MEKSLHPLWRFWRAVYGAHSRSLSGGLEFKLPGFHDPLLSPCFAFIPRNEFLGKNPDLLYFNEISDQSADRAPEGFVLEKEFLLGQKAPMAYSLPDEFEAEEVSLGWALKRSEYWQLIGEGFPADFPFLRLLLPFLSQKECFTVIFLRLRQETVGVITVGAGGDSALVMNAVVGRKFRGLGISRLLAMAASDFCFRIRAKSAFFWTEHEFLGAQAEEVSWYRIWRRKKA